MPLKKSSAPAKFLLFHVSTEDRRINVWLNSRDSKLHKKSRTGFSEFRFVGLTLVKAPG
ncbi:hypothetical protein [Turicimonas muris]|uniref:hypothetical protein n=1 Tax=Turicimonas muris TaxID=1796652 RepID=UPI0026F292E8|nr:hypothetical protein [Turicimonas muris]